MYSNATNKVFNCDMPIMNNNTLHIHKLNRKERIRRNNMIKQKTYGVILALCGLLPMLIEKDATAFIFLAFLFLPMIFGKRYVMNFKE